MLIPDAIYRLAKRVDELLDAHLLLDDILNRAQVEVDMEVWGAALQTEQSSE